MSYARASMFQLKPGTFDLAVKKALEGLLPLFRKQEGFICYDVVKGENDRGTSLVAFNTREQADAAVKLTAQWIQDNIKDILVSRDTYRGELVIDAQGGRETGKASGATVIEAVFAAFNAKDFERAASLANPGALVTNIPYGRALPIVEDLKMWAAGFPDAKVEIVSSFESGNTVVTEYIGRGTHTGTLQTPLGPFAATNRPVELRLVDVTTLRDGKVDSVRTYFDVASMAQQLGPLPTAAIPRGGAGAPAPEARH